MTIADRALSGPSESAVWAIILTLVLVVTIGLVWAFKQPVRSAIACVAGGATAFLVIVISWLARSSWIDESQPDKPAVGSSADRSGIGDPTGTAAAYDWSLGMAWGF